jgi:Protein of unknown function (DUF2510)
MSTPGSQPPPGWYADPAGGGGWRWWDGTRWTEHLAPASPPAPPGPGSPAPPHALGPVGTPLPPPPPGVRRYRQKWWHIPLVIGIAVLWTAIWIAVQFLSA